MNYDVRVSRYGLAIIAAVFALTTSSAHAIEPPETYRGFTFALPASMSFDVQNPLGPTEVKYQFAWADPLMALPSISIFPDLQGDPTQRYIEFYDRISLDSTSTLSIGGVMLPLTCAWVHGQDNTERDNQDPLIPKYVLKILLVANDFSCTGPINPGWPENGLRKETWDTYVEILIKDLTIYRPAEATLRYRWNESKMIVKTVGPKQIIPPALTANGR